MTSDDAGIGPAASRTGRLPSARLAPPLPILPQTHPVERLTARARQIFDGLEEIFFAEGFTDVTVGELASRLHCSLRTLYGLAPSKDELVLVVVDRVLQRVGREASERARQQARRIDQLHVYLHTVALGFGHASLTFSRDVQRAPAVQRVFSAHVAYGVSVLEALIDRAVVEGEFQPVHAGLVAELLIAGMKCVQDPAVLESTGLTLADGIDELARVFSDGLLCRPDPREARGEEDPRP